ncbi:MAG: xanthine dehydrogenase family protein subunit M [Calditrichia bacterium]
MKNFEYLQPKSIEEASKLLGSDWKASLLYAGGIDLLGLMKDGIETPEKVVNIKGIPGLDKIDYAPGKGLRVGSLVRIADVAAHEVIRQKYAVLAQAAQRVASPQLRNMGTIGGNLCQRPRCWYYRGDFHCLRKGGDLCYAVDGENKYHCIIGGGPCFIVHPSDMAVALVALNARIEIASQAKRREVALQDFFVLPEVDVLRENILKPGEIITEIRVPEPPDNTRSGYLKFTERSVWDFAMVSVAAVLQMTGKLIQGGKVVFGGVAPIPWAEETVTHRMRNLPASAAALDKLADKALNRAEPLAGNQYKLILARNLLKRLLTDLTTA